MHSKTGANEVDVRVADGDEIAVGDVKARVLHTPGHTKDSITLVFPDRILTGDFLFLGEGGAGRTDLLGGDPGEHWDALQKLAGLSGEVQVFPGHDYHCRQSSSLAEERVKNTRLQPRTRGAYVEWLAGFKLGAAPWMLDVVRANFACTRDPKAVAIPAETATCEVKGGADPGPPGAAAVKTITPEELAEKLGRREPAFVLDVRNPDEFTGELGHIDGALLIPLPELPARLGELKGRERDAVYTVCKMGGRSAKAAGILTAAGFTNVTSVAGGMARWCQAQLPVRK
jgi:rhodanese-related sulfurtransferase